MHISIFVRLEVSLLVLEKAEETLPERSTDKRIVVAIVIRFIGYSFSPVGVALLGARNTSVPTTQKNGFCGLKMKKIKRG